MISSTVSDIYGDGEEDLSDYLGLCDSERDFAQRTLFDSVSLPLAIMGRRDGKEFPIVILRQLIFETSICLALEFESFDARLLSFLFGGELDGALASPRVKSLVSNIAQSETFGAEFYRSARTLRELLALGDKSLHKRLAKGYCFDELKYCVESTVGIDIRFQLTYKEPGVGESGRVFSPGFCICAALAVALAASVFSSDLEARMEVIFKNGHTELDISYQEAKRRVWRGNTMLSRIAQTYGMPLELQSEEGRMRCRIIPEYADEALEGVKEDVIAFEAFSDSFGLVE